MVLKASHLPSLVTTPLQSWLLRLIEPGVVLGVAEAVLEVEVVVAAEEAEAAAAEGGDG